MNIAQFFALRLEDGYPPGISLKWWNPSKWKPWYSPPVTLDLRARRRLIADYIELENRPLSCRDIRIGLNLEWNPGAMLGQMVRRGEIGVSTRKQSHRGDTRFLYTKIENSEIGKGPGSVGA